MASQFGQPDETDQTPAAQGGGLNERGKEASSEIPSQRKIDEYITALTQRIQSPHEGDDVELLKEQLANFEKVLQDRHVMAWAKIFLKRMRKDKQAVVGNRSPIWSMWYEKEDSYMCQRSDADTYLTPFPDTMISIGKAMELIVNAELNSKGKEHAFGNFSVIHNTGFDEHKLMQTRESELDLKQRDGESSQEWLQRTIPKVFPPSLYSFDTKSNEARWPSRFMPPVRYEVSGFGTEDLVEGLQRGWKEEEKVQELQKRQKDSVFGELALVELEGYDLMRKAEFQSALSRMRRQTNITGEEWLRLWEDTFDKNRQFAHRAIRNFRIQGYPGADSIDIALNTLRQKREKEV